MGKLTINSDIDGVLYDFNAAMTEYGEQALGRKLPVTKNWKMWTAWEISRDEWYALFHEAIKHGQVFRVGHEVPGAVDAIHELVAHKHRVRLVTSKKLLYPSSTKAAQIQVIRWLAEKELLNKVELAFTSDKQGYQADVVIDDKPTLAWAQTGALNMLFAQPWNEDVPEEAYFSVPAITRVENWEDVLAHIHWSDYELTDAGRGGG